MPPAFALSFRPRYVKVRVLPTRISSCPQQRVPTVCLEVSQNRDPQPPGTKSVPTLPHINSHLSPDQWPSGYSSMLYAVCCCCCRQEYSLFLLNELLRHLGHVLSSWELLSTNEFRLAPYADACVSAQPGPPLMLVDQCYIFRRLQICTSHSSFLHGTLPGSSSSSSCRNPGKQKHDLRESTSS